MSILNVCTILLYILSAASYLFFLLAQKRYLYKIGLYLLICGFIACTTKIAAAAFIRGQIPVHNLSETLFIGAWAISAVFIFFEYRFDIKALGAFAGPLIALTIIAASVISVKPVETKLIYDSFWLILHIITVFIGEASFALACCAGILYLLQEYGIKSKKQGFFYTRLPSLNRIDASIYACIVAGFVMLTIGIATGFVYAHTVWNRIWSGDPKEIWSAVIWIFYAALLHARLGSGWTGKRSAIMSIIGFVALLFTFFGVNFLFAGHHQDFTR